MAKSFKDISTTGAQRPFADALGRLKEAGLRPTRQRLALAKLLFDGGDQHVTAEQLHVLARDASVSVSLATVYNTLHQFRESGLLREVVVGPGRSYFDTNTHDHHHFYVEPQGELIDIPMESVEVSRLPTPPEGTALGRVDVIIRVNRN
ncbi:transcriptional repressor [Rhodospirillaceae bacterium KN72]|uniref:Ferric uptake regulation protein n=1 Tax=Pacificispira spongiicola TaxID=2729598 RepID=A0A7Y0E1B8_9PROT|nr:Fur family transcriptional regulator [Pacificispira spongiicola]NMM45333.1 transcriptional repressor [Pacificispira spongiicola]